MGEGGPALVQRAADRGGEQQGGENRVSSHTNLHTNLPISVRSCARSMRTGGHQRWLHVVENLSSYPEMCAEPGVLRGSSVARVLLGDVHGEHLLEQL